MQDWKITNLIGIKFHGLKNAGLRIDGPSEKCIELIAIEQPGLMWGII